MTIKIVISYDGTRFYGSQKQPDSITVQGELEKALSLLNIKTKTNFSGRTDKGVHATFQVVSCTVPVFWHNLDKLKHNLNYILR